LLQLHARHHLPDTANVQSQAITANLKRQHEHDDPREVMHI
jgi:hypothetical protein